MVKESFSSLFETNIKKITKPEGEQERKKAANNQYKNKKFSSDGSYIFFAKK